MGLYNEKGFVNFKWVKELGLPFNILVGGRGIGKTYGCLEDMLTGGEKFYFARRTDKQLQQLARPDQDPTIDINLNRGTNFCLRTVPKVGMGFYDCKQNEDGEWEPEEEPLGSCQSMSTVANLRGAGGGVLYKYLVYDEFIKLTHEKPFRGEDTAFADLYETINRNRELPPPRGSGAPPLQAFLLSNSNRIDSPILAAFNLINQAAKMQATAEATGKDQIYINREKGILFVYFAESEISKAKANTALYKALGQDSSYTAMAVGNKFADDTQSDIKSMPIIEYRPLVSVGELTIYLHKNGSHYYVSTHRMKAPNTYNSGTEEFEKFSRKWRKLYAAYMDDKLFFEDYGAKVAFLHYFSY